MNFTIELHPWITRCVDYVVRVCIKRCPVVVANRISIAVFDSIKIAPENQIPAPLVVRWGHQDSDGRIVWV